MTPLRELDRQFAQAADDQLAAWEASQPAVRVTHRRYMPFRRVIWLAVIALTTGLVGGALFFGQLQGLWG